MNGIILVNGTPPGKLPLAIKTHHLFRRVFMETDFEVTVNRSGYYCTRKPFNDRMYNFRLKGSELIIYECYQNKQLRLLDYKACSTWGKGIPTGMIELYSHWQSGIDKVVYFRPIHFQKRTIFYLLTEGGLFKVPCKDRECSRSSEDTILSKTPFYDKYLLLYERLRACIEFFAKFDQIEYIHPYFTHDKVFKVFLARHRISFELKNGANHYECPEFGEYKLHVVQQFDDKLYGFYEYLMMENNLGEVTVIIPQGSVIENTGSVSIKRQTSEEVDDVSAVARSFDTFSLHPHFNTQL